MNKDFMKGTLFGVGISVLVAGGGWLISTLQERGKAVALRTLDRDLKPAEKTWKELDDQIYKMDKNDVRYADLLKRHAEATKVYFDLTRKRGDILLGRQTLKVKK